MIHRANADFWNDYRALPANIRAIADKQFALLKTILNTLPCNSKNSATATGRKSGRRGWTLKYRVLAVKMPDEYVWFWIGEHNVYDALIK